MKPKSANKQFVVARCTRLDTAKNTATQFYVMHKMNIEELAEKYEELGRPIIHKAEAPTVKDCISVKYNGCKIMGDK